MAPSLGNVKDALDRRRSRVGIAGKGLPRDGHWSELRLQQSHRALGTIHLRRSRSLKNRPDLCPAYYAMRQQGGPAIWQSLKVEAIDVANNIAAICGMSDPAGSLPPDARALKTCLFTAYTRQAAIWAAKLSGPAAEESIRPIEWHIELQRRLQTLGYIAPTETPDGVYGTGLALRSRHGSKRRTGRLPVFYPMPMRRHSPIGPELLPRRHHHQFQHLPRRPRHWSKRDSQSPGPHKASCTSKYLERSFGGDADRFAYTVSTLTEAPLVILNSPGGEVENGLAIARLVYSKNLNTYAYERCASMCFVIFSAGHYRSFAPGTRIGVHSASTVSNRDPDDPFETDRSFTLTMEIVRTLQSFNRARPIPETIFGKLVGRARNEIAILTPGDLMAMDAFMDPPSTLPVITPAVEQEAREGTPQQSGERVTQWINAYTNAYSRGMPPLYCDVNLPCLEGARDYAVTIGMEGIAAEAKRYADAIPKHVAPPIVPARTVQADRTVLSSSLGGLCGIRRELRHAAPRVVRDHSVWFSCNSLGICNRKNIVTGSHLDSCSTQDDAARCFAHAT